MKRIIKTEMDKNELLDIATQIVLAAKSEANGHIDINAKNNGYDYQYDKDALEKFEEQYEYDKDEYADYDNCASDIIGQLLGVIMCLVNIERPEQKWRWTELGKKAAEQSPNDKGRE